MNRNNSVSRLYVRNWKLLLFSYFVPVLLLIPFSIAAGRGHEGSLFLVLLSLASLVCATAFFLASVQQDFLSRSFTYLLPGLRRGMLRQHLVAAVVLMVVVAVLVLTLPGFAGLTASPLALAWSTACLMAAIYGITLLVIYLVPYAAWLPFNAVWLVFVFIKLWVRTPPETLAGILDQPLIWTPLALLAGWLVHNRLSRPALHRRLVEQPYISLADLKDQAKIEQFKQARRKHKQSLEPEHRPGSGLIRRARERANRHMVHGEHARAVMWDAICALLLTSIPRGRVRVWLLGLFLPVLVIWLGYLDSYMQADGSGLVGWFPGFAFMTTWLYVIVFHHVKTRPLGLLRSRRDMHRAGWLAMLTSLVVTLALSGFVWLLFVMGSRMLPPFTLLGWDLAFHMPPGYLPLLPLFFLPVQFLVHSLWRIGGSYLVLQQTGTLSFFVFHAMLLLGNGAVNLLAVGLAVLCWLALPLAWRWRVYRTDLA